MQQEGGPQGPYMWFFILNQWPVNDSPHWFLYDQKGDSLMLELPPVHQAVRRLSSHIGIWSEIWWWRSRMAKAQLRLPDCHMHILICYYWGKLPLEKWLRVCTNDWLIHLEEKGSARISEKAHWHLVISGSVEVSNIFIKESPLWTVVPLKYQMLSSRQEEEENTLQDLRHNFGACSFYERNAQK